MLMGDCDLHEAVFVCGGGQSWKMVYMYIEMNVIHIRVYASAYSREIVYMYTCIINKYKRI